MSCRSNTSFGVLANNAAALLMLLVTLSHSAVAQSTTPGEPRLLDESTTETERDSEPAEAASLLAEAYRATATAKTEEDLTRIIETCKQALSAEPDAQSSAYADRLLAWTYNKRGEVVAEMGREEDALADFEEAVRLDPDRWQAIHNRAVSYAVLGRYEAAMADLDRTIRLRPTFAKAYYNRGELKYGAGDYRAAVEDYAEVIRLNPRDAQAYVSRGHAYYRLRNARAAFRDFSQAIRLDPDNAEAYTYRGDAYADQGNFTQAANDYRTAIRADANFSRAYQSAAWLMATCADQRYLNPQLALDAARKAIEIAGDSDYRYLETLAAALARAGEFDEAKKIQAQVIDMAPRDQTERQRSRLELYSDGQAYRDVREQRR